jgi:hypothetical protein
VYLKYVSVSQQLIVPKLEDLVLRYRPLKMGAISCQQKYLTVIFFACLQVGESTTANKAGEDTCGCSRKVARLEMVHKAGFSRNTYEEILAYT